MSGGFAVKAVHKIMPNVAVRYGERTHPSRVASKLNGESEQKPRNAFSHYLNCLVRRFFGGPKKRCKWNNQKVQKDEDWESNLGAGANVRNK